MKKKKKNPLDPQKLEKPKPYFYQELVSFA